MMVYLRRLLNNRGLFGYINTRGESNEYINNWR